MRIYSDLLRTPSIGVLLAATTLTRIPFAINGLALLLYMREVSGSFATAGLVTGALALGAAFGAPLVSRLVDRRGAGTLVSLAFGNAAGVLGLIALGEAGVAGASAVAVALLAGACFPPSGSVLRARFPEMLGERPELLRSAYALDSVTIEVSFVSGPLITALALATLGAEAALGLSALLVVAGTVLFVSRLPAELRTPLHVDERSSGLLGALSVPAVRTVAFSTVPIGFCLGTVEVALPAFAATEHSAVLAGVLLSVWSAASGVGGLVFGARTRHRHVVEVYLWMAIVLPLACAPLALAGSPVVMLVLVLVAGAPIAPAIASRNELVGDVAPGGSGTEAFTWLMTALVVGLAAGNAVAGAVVDALGWPEAVLVGCAVALAGAALTFSRRAVLRPARATA